MTVAEYRRQRRENERRKLLAAQLVAEKERREQATRRERAAREPVAFALKHRLPPERIYEPEPRLKFPGGFGGLRPSPRPEELARRSRRVDEILESFGLR